MSTFNELLRQKEEILRRLVPVSEQQLRIVRQNDLSVLLHLLAVKQRLMNEFESIEKQLQSFQQLPPEERSWENEAEKLSIDSRLERCEAMLEEIIQSDSMSMEELEVQKNNTEKQLKRLRQGSKVFDSYKRFS
jgi:hypothetical protein